MDPTPLGMPSTSDPEEKINWNIVRKTWNEAVVGTTEPSTTPSLDAVLSGEYESPVPLEKVKKYMKRLGVKAETPAGTAEFGTGGHAFVNGKYIYMGEVGYPA
jgi:hypothetical protein